MDNWEIIAVLCTEGGGVEHNTAVGGYSRTLHWDTQSGRLILRGEYHHGLDFEVHYWWCTVGNALANGDIRAQLELPGNDHSAELVDDGFSLKPDKFWAYRLENIKGSSPYTRIQVRDAPGVHSWHDVVPTKERPVSGWLYGERVQPHHAGPVWVALSHAQLEALNGSPIPREENSVLVDLGVVMTNIGSSV